MAEQAVRQTAEALSICKGSTRAGASFFAGHRPQGHLLAALCERGDVGIATYEMTCRAGPMCPAAKDTFSPAGHAGPALQGARVLGGQSRPPLQTGRRGRRTIQREALSLRGAKRRGNPFSPCLPLRGRWQREALTERDVIRFFSPPVGCADSPLPEGALQRGSAALTGRRTPRAFVPLRSTAGRRPLRSGLPYPSVGRAKNFCNG